MIEMLHAWLDENIDELFGLSEDGKIKLLTPNNIDLIDKFFENTAFSTAISNLHLGQSQNASIKR